MMVSTGRGEGRGERRGQSFDGICSKERHSGAAQSSERFLGE